MIDYIYKFYLILNFKQKLLFSFVIILGFLGSFLEIVSLALFLPLIAMMINYNNNSLGESLTFIRNVTNYFNIDITEDSFFYLIIILLLVFIFKTIFFCVLNFFNLKFINNVNYSISSKIFSNYLCQDYNFFIKNNSSKLINNLTTGVGNFIYLFLTSLINIINEILIIAGVSLILFVLNPAGFFLVVSCFLLIALFFLFTTKNLLKEWSETRQYSQTKIIQYIQEGIRNIRDLKISGKEKYFENYFNNFLVNFINSDYKVTFLRVIPKYFFELTGVIIFVIIYYFFKKFDLPRDQILIILSFFILASLKILPSVNRLVNSFISFRYSYASIDTIFTEISLDYPKNYSNNNSLNITYKKAANSSIKISNLSFNYIATQKYLFKDLNLSILSNNVTGLTGISGSGKSTMLNLITGLIKPDLGSISFNEIDIYYDLRSYQSSIGFVQQFNYLIDSSIKKNIAFGIDDNKIDLKVVNHLIKELNLEDLINGFSKGIDEEVGELGEKLSGGQRQRIAIARALYNNPSIIIFDEATNALDEENEDIILDFLFKLKNNKIIIISTHSQKILKKCDMLIEIQKDKVIQK
jgi:ABC-type multidrug transport system fused ATPase/permease subunit